MLVIRFWSFVHVSNGSSKVSLCVINGGIGGGVLGAHGRRVAFYGFECSGSGRGSSREMVQRFRNTLVLVDQCDPGMTCSSPRCTVRSHSLVCSKIYF